MREEMKRMGGLMQPAVDMAVRKVVSQAVAEKEEKDMLTSIRNLMKNMKWTAQQAMEALGIPNDEQSNYAALI